MSQKEFNYTALPWNIIFGAGAVHRLAEEIDKLGFSKPLVLVTPGHRAQGEELAEELGLDTAWLFDQAAMHVPMQTVTLAQAQAKELGADCSISLGGGSTTGLGKALALKSDLPNIAIPTSYAGSEMTNIWGITQDGKKVTGRDNKVLPNLTLYDPELTYSLPPSFAASSGLNAIAQAAVNIASGEANPVVSLMAIKAVQTLSQNLPRILTNPEDTQARAETLYGACLAGASLGTGTTGIHHRLCHTLGGSFNTPHAETHAVILPYSIAYNAAATKEGTAKLAEALGAQDAATGLRELAKKLGAPLSLQEIGIEEADLDKAAEIATDSPLSNPEPISRDRIRNLLQNAFDGAEPIS
jgi:maleylacetate reductase